MTQTEVLRFALEAFETSMYPQQKQLQAITAIKAALEAPQRTWVGLTDEEVTWLCNTAKSHEQTWGMFVRAIEAKLRSKNHD